MTNQLHELPDVPLEPPESTTTMATRLALAQSLAAMKRAGWPTTADQVAAMASVRHALQVSA